MDKVDILKQICELPGWQPPPPNGSSVERALGELVREGWIAPRLDGWEATADALECYPLFWLADDGAVHGRARTETAVEAGSETTATVSIERFELLVRALIEFVPLGAVVNMLALREDNIPGSKDDVSWRTARELTQQFLKTDSPTTPSASPTSSPA